MYRDLMCGEVSSSVLEKKIKLAGWVSKRRDHGQLIFIDLRDKSGIMQIVFNPEISAESHSYAKNLRSEWVIAVEGTIVRRLDGSENKEIPTGDLELVVDKIEILSTSKTTFEIDDDSVVSEEIRLKYRYLDLREILCKEKKNCDGK